MASQSTGYSIITTIETEHNRRILSLVVTPVVKANYANVCGQDITARAQAERALRESEQHYRTVFEGVQDGFYLARIMMDDAGTPCDFVYLAANPAFGRIMHLAPGQIIGRRAKELVPDLKSTWLDVFGRVVRTGKPARYSDYSEVFRQHLETFVFRPTEGQFAVLVMDITERMRAEEELRRQPGSERL